MITPSQTGNQQVKPKWNLPVGVMEGIVAYNCRKHGFPRPVLAMPMWEGAGNRAIDFSGYGNNGDMINNPIWVGNGIDFNGINHRIECGTDPILEVQGHTIFCMLRSGSWENTKMIFAKAYNITIAGVEWGVRSPGNLAYAYYDSTLRGWFVDTTALPLDEDISLSGVWDDAGDVTFYVGGEESSSASTSAGTIRYNSDEAVIGDQQQNNEFDGVIQQFILFAEVLSPAQIKFLHDDPYFMYRIPEEMYGYTAAVGGITIPVLIHHLKQHGIS